MMTRLNFRHRKNTSYCVFGTLYHNPLCRIRFVITFTNLLFILLYMAFEVHSESIQIYGI